MSDVLDIVIDDGIATITLNRPAAYNTLSVEMLDVLPVLLGQLRDDDNTRCIILTGAGEKAFCAGGDISGLVSGSAGIDKKALSEKLSGWAQSARLLREIPKPTLAMINGAVAGAGLALALACDFRIASRNAHFTTAFSKLAMSGDFGGSYFLSQIVGTAKARELYYFSERVGSEEALRIGLINWLVDYDDLADSTLELAKKLALMPALTAAFIKQNMNDSLSDDIATLIEKESYRMIESAMSEETQQAATAFFSRSKK